MIGILEKNRLPGTRTNGYGIDQVAKELFEKFGVQVGFTEFITDRFIVLVMAQRHLLPRRSVCHHRPHEPTVPLSATLGFL